MRSVLAAALLIAQTTLSFSASMQGVTVDFGEPYGCDILVHNRDKMPELQEYIEAKPGAKALGYGSECRLGNLVFAQCFLEPRWSIDQAIAVLIDKATHGKPLPDTPACGA
jgi:hypothetical protein